MGPPGAGNGQWPGQNTTVRRDGPHGVEEAVGPAPGGLHPT